MDFSTLMPNLIAALIYDRDRLYSFLQSDDYDDIFDDLAMSSSASSSESSVHFKLSPEPKTHDFTPINPLKYLEIPSHHTLTLYASPRLPAYVVRVFSTKPRNHNFRKLILSKSHTSPVCDSHVRAILNTGKASCGSVEVFIVPEGKRIGENITADMTITLSKSFVNLRVLVLDGVPTFNDNTFSVLAHTCTKLEYIRISSWELFDKKITDKSLQLLHSSPVLPKLKELVLFDQNKISDVETYKLCKARWKLAVTTGFTVEGAKITETWYEGKMIAVSVDREGTQFDDDIEENAKKMGIDTSVEGWEEEYFKDEADELEGSDDEIIEAEEEAEADELRKLIFAPFS